MLFAAACTTGSFFGIEGAQQGQPDWSNLIHLALHHRMVPPLLAVLDHAGSGFVPPDLLAALRSHCETLRAQSLTLVDEVFALLETLEARRVTVVPFKGPLLGEMLFGDVGQRSPGDIDLLIRREDARTVCGVLKAQGYRDADQGQGAAPLSNPQRRLYEQFQCEYQYAREVDDMVVEPHWNLCQRALAIDVDYMGMLDRAQPATLSGRSVLTLAPEDLLVALCVHGSKHQWQRLAWIRDVAGVLAAFPDIDLHRVLRQARTRGYARLLLLSLAVARDYAGAALPGDMVRIIESDRTLVGLMDDIGRRLFDLAAMEPRNDRIERFRLQMREKWSNRLQYIGLTIIAPRRHHLELVSLPASLSWGYYPLKLGIDYAALPVWELLKSCRTRIALMK